jgi:AmiR/NasT family two-component response regulator
MRILVAEDDPVIALGLAERLRSLGHEPIGPVGDGEAALAAALSDPPDLYLFDVDMPIIDGVGVAERLAALGVRRPVVIVTGVNDAKIIDRSVAAGVGAYLTKPIDDRELDAAIRVAAARHEELRRAEQALEERKVVERAKGLLMAALQISEAEAFRRLQRTARERNLRLVDVARRIVAEESLLDPAR